MLGIASRKDAMRTHLGMFPGELLDEAAAALAAVALQVLSISKSFDCVITGSDYRN